MKKNKKKIITPDDIDSLFSNKNAKSEEKDEEEDDDDSEGLEEYENDVSDENSDKNKQLQTNKFNPMIGADEVIPQWLQDAEKAEKKRKAMKGKKQKKITDDWRFWISLIAGAGFVSAFVNIYQQTGGFGGGTGTDELII